MVPKPEMVPNQENKLDKLRTSPEEQIKHTEKILSILRESTKHMPSPQLERMIDFFEKNKGEGEEIIDGYNKLLEKKVKINESEYKENGIVNEKEMSVEDLLEFDPLTFVTLTVYLPHETEVSADGKPKTDLYRTFGMYCDEIKRQYSKIDPKLIDQQGPSIDEDVFDAGYVQSKILENSIRWAQNIVPPEPGFYWEVISTGTMYQQPITEVRTKLEEQKKQSEMPHLGILSTAAVNPGWLQLMDAEKVPFVEILGLEFKEKNDEWDGVLKLTVVINELPGELEPRRTVGLLSRKIGPYFHSPTYGTAIPIRKEFQSVGY